MGTREARRIIRSLLSQDAPESLDLVMREQDALVRQED